MMIKDGIYSYKDLSFIENDKILEMIKNLYKNVIENDNDCLAISLNEIDCINLDNQIYFVYFKDNVIIGLIKAYKSIYFKRQHYLRDGTLLIHPSYQSFGYGAKLVIKFLDYINQSNIYDCFEIETKEINVKFYQKLGFRLLGEINSGMKKHNSNEYNKLCKMIYEKKNYKNKALQELAEKSNISLYEFDDKFEVDLFGICDKLNIETILDENLFKLSSEYKDNKIFINKKETGTRGYFLIARELYYFMNNIQYCRFKYDNEGQDVDDFALRLLMPEYKFIEIYNNKKKDLLEVARFFGVPVNIAIYRQCQLNLGLI